MSPGDFLRKDAQTPLTGHYLMAGSPGFIATNFEPILAAAKDSFWPVESPTEEPHIRLRVWVDPKGASKPPWPKPFFRGHGDLIFAGFDTQSAIMIDLRRRLAFGRVSPAMADDSAYWRTIIFPVLMSMMAGSIGITELHCGCVAKDETGFLLVGRSGSGKSTLTLALAQAGCAYLSDDRTFISRRDGRITAWGLPTALKLRADAAGWFPDLEDLARGAASNGRSDLRIDPARQLGIRRIKRCEPRGIIFLERRNDATFELSSMPRPAAAARLEEDLIVEIPHVAAQQRALIAKLVELPGWRLAYSGTPQAAAHAFNRHFWRVVSY